MSTWAIGDIQGCFATLERLLERIGFDPGRDRLWLVGDLVNRGPRSLSVLRWAHGLGERATVVLGNHDLHLLAVAAGVRRLKRRDTLEKVLTAPDREGLLGWLRTRPLLHREGGRVLVHAGLAPEWTVAEAEGLARAVERELAGPGMAALLRELHEGPTPDRWHTGLTAARRRVVALACLTRLRTVTGDGRFDFDYSGPPERAPAGSLPWFAVPGRRSRDETIVCGHWATLGLRLEPGLVALDTGCVWGQDLTAVRLEDGVVHRQPVSRQEGVAPRG